ncbi:hypothetical protein [Undibacterium sp. Ji50W]|uniref:hypothetical protein n=1 Tax=Undibacterium sp. Ji50W TaxID=3413041 RepID=UPI003BF45FB4
MMMEDVDNATEKTTQPSGGDVIEMSGDLMGAVALAYGSPVDFDGVTISVLREPGTNRLLALIISPVDMQGDEPFARYQVHPDQVAKARQRSLIVPA